MSKIHFVERDTDSMYWPVSGSELDNYEQEFKHVIKDHTFYNENIYKYTPAHFYSNKISNATFDGEMERMIFDKKILGLDTKKQCGNIILLEHKTYTCSTNNTMQMKKENYNKSDNKNKFLTKYY
jgi:hypothetical protein